MPQPSTTTQTSTTPTQTTKPTNNISHILIIATCVVATAGIVLIATRGIQTREAPVTATTTSPTPIIFPSVALEARAAYVYDARTGTELFSKNGTTPLPIASLTKILTALVAVQDASAIDEITISSTALATEGESGLTLNERWLIDDLAAFMLVVSSNDASTALREAYETATDGSFIAAMNNKATALGLTQTTIVNETGLDRGFGYETNAGSPRDMALLLTAALSEESELFEKTQKDSSVFTSLTGTRHVANNTNMLANDIPWSLGAKTGFTDSAGGNLAVAFDISVGHPVVVVVMGSSRDGRFEDVRTLIEATREAMSY